MTDRFKLTPELIEKIENFINGDDCDLPPKQAASSRPTIRRLCGIAKYSMPIKGARVDFGLAVQMREAGVPGAEIAKHLGVTAASLAAMLSRKGLTKRRPKLTAEAFLASRKAAK
jgi:hypothetical protein